MPRGDKSKYTDKQERKVDHIAEGYEERGVPEQEAEPRAWATVNKDDGGAETSRWKMAEIQEEKSGAPFGTPSRYRR